MLVFALWGFGLFAQPTPVSAPALQRQQTLPASVTKGHRVNYTASHTISERRGRAFIGIRDFSGWERQENPNAPNVVLTSPMLPVDIAANEIVCSWNADAPSGTGLKVEARAFQGEHATTYYVMGLWSKEVSSRESAKNPVKPEDGFPRESVNHQKDADGDVDTDTLVLNKPATGVQLRVTLEARPGAPLPTLKFAGVCLADTHAPLTLLEPNRSVWGKEIVVPGKSQLSYPGGGGWCSPTSTSMTLAFWAKSLHRPELDISVPDTAHLIHDRVYGGTGNWPFNTAFAGSFPGIRAYVTRLSDIREMEDWIAIGIPPIVSVSYDLLKGKPHDNDPGHLMVCDGFTPTGDIVLNDPAHHPERGEVCRRVFPRANFQRAWNRSKYLVYLIYPEGSKLPADTYGHWEQ